MRCFLQALGAVLLVGLYGCSGEEVISTEAVLRPVKVIEFGVSAQERKRVFSGLSQSAQEARLSFKVGGTIEKLPVKLGAELEPGQLIAQLDPVTYELEVQQSEASLLERESALRNASNNYRRMKELYTNASVSKGELDSARANEESARAQVSAATKSLQIAKLNRSYTRLVAEDQCRVVSIDAEVNENVSSGTQIASVDCGDTIEIELTVPESLVSNFKVGLETVVAFSALGDATYRGLVSEVGVSSTAQGSTFPVTIEVVESDGAVRPGMAADVAIVFPAPDAGRVSTVPAEALLGDADATYVLLASPGGGDQRATVARRNVKVGDFTNEGIEVLSGLDNGELVIVAGTSVLREGQEILLP